MKKGKDNSKSTINNSTDQQGYFLPDSILNSTDIFGYFTGKFSNIILVIPGNFLLDQSMVIKFLKFHALSWPRITPAIEGNKGCILDKVLKSQ